MDEKSALVKNWLDKARRDLDSALRLAAGSPPYLDTAIYHCQQAAEKAVKGWLVSHDQRFERTHDVRLLVSLAATIEPAFERWFDAAESLTPYAIVYRYPGETPVPEPGEFEQAYQNASGLLEFVVALLPANFPS